MKQLPIDADINYASRRLDVNYKLLSETTRYTGTNVTIRRASTCGSGEVPGLLITCSLLPSSAGNTPFETISADISKLGFKTGDVINYVEIQFTENGGPSKGSIIVRTGFPY
jgi:hypothetical protein